MAIFRKSDKFPCKHHCRLCTFVDGGRQRQPRATTLLNSLIKLLQQGLIARTPRGRMLTSASWRHLGLDAPRNGTQSELFEPD